MADLTFIEKSKLEKLLGMDSGYVLNFSDKTFKAFVADSTKKDIFDATYKSASGSKAHRLRAFWNREHNLIVGKLLADLLDYRASYGPSNDASETSLLNDCRQIVQKLLGYTSGSAAHQSPAPDYIRFGIVTALEKEYVAMKCMLDSASEHVTPRGRIYWCGQVAAKGGSVHNVALALADQGTAVATHRATLLIEDFNQVEAVLMVGIAGGVPNTTKPERHVRLGDIVVSGEHGVVAYDFVKEHTTHLEPRHPPRPPHAPLYQACRRLSAAAIEAQFPWLEHLTRASHLPGSIRPDGDTDLLAEAGDQSRQLQHPVDPERTRHPGVPRVFLGTIACANRLLKNPLHRDHIRDNFDVRAVEMEGFGIAEATWNQNIGYLVIRGICDYCDTQKGDSWQAYAAIIAAAYARAVLGELPALRRQDALNVHETSRPSHSEHGAGKAEMHRHSGISEPASETTGADGSDDDLNLLFLPPSPATTQQFQHRGFDHWICQSVNVHGGYSLQSKYLIPAEDGVSRVSAVQALHRELRETASRDQPQAWRVMNSWATLIERGSIIANAIGHAAFRLLDERPLAVDVSRVKNWQMVRWYTGRLLLRTGSSTPLATFGTLATHPDESTSLNACDAISDLLKHLFHGNFLQSHREASNRVIDPLSSSLRHESLRTREAAFTTMLWVDHPDVELQLTSALEEGRVSRRSAQTIARQNSDAPQAPLIDQQP